MTGNDIGDLTGISTDTLHVDPNTDADIRGAVPIGKLKELIQEWENATYETEREGRVAEYKTERLRELIGEHTDE